MSTVANQFDRRLEIHQSRTRRLNRGRARMLAATDTLALAIAYTATYVAANQIAPPAVVAPGAVLAVLAALAVPTGSAIFAAYRRTRIDGKAEITVSSFDEIGDVFHALLAGSLGYLLLAQILKRFVGWQIFSAVEALLFVLGAFISIPLGRGALRSWVFPRVMRQRRALIVGAGADARLVHRKLLTHPEYGLEVIGFLDSSEGDGVVGEPHEVARVVDELEVDRVLLASSLEDHEGVIDLIHSVRRADVQVSIIPRYNEIFTPRRFSTTSRGCPVTLPPMRLERSRVCSSAPSTRGRRNDPARCSRRCSQHRDRDSSG